MLRHPPLLDWDDRPLPPRFELRRFIWPAVTGLGYLTVLGYVLGHDDPQPGLSDRGWLTLFLAALLLVLLSVHRARGPRPLARALAEYAVVALLAVLLATASAGSQPPAKHPSKASAAGQHRPTVERVLTGMGDWLGRWRRWANQEANRDSTPPTTTRPKLK